MRRRDLFSAVLDLPAPGSGDLEALFRQQGAKDLPYPGIVVYDQNPGDPVLVLLSVDRP